MASKLRASLLGAMPFVTIVASCSYSSKARSAPSSVLAPTSDGLQPKTQVWTGHPKVDRTLPESQQRRGSFKSASDDVAKEVDMKGKKQQKKRKSSKLQKGWLGYRIPFSKGLTFLFAIPFFKMCVFLNCFFYVLHRCNIHIPASEVYHGSTG